MFAVHQTALAAKRLLTLTRKAAIVSAVALPLGNSVGYAQLVGNAASAAQSSKAASTQADHAGHDHSGHNHGKQSEFLDYAAETEKFKQALSAMREQIKVIRAAEVNYDTSDTKEQERRYRREYHAALEPMPALHIKVLEAALEEFKAAPAERVKLGQILFKTLKRNADKDNFEGMLPIAVALVESGYPSPDLAQIHLQCCLAVNDFAQARSVIQMNEKSIANPAVMLTALDSLEQDWKEELEARARDAAGDPLPQVKINTTKGSAVVELFENDAPEAVASFIHLAESGFFENLDFFYVGDHQVAQTGSPNEDGTDGPGYMLIDENNKPGARKLFCGSLALALLPGRKDSGGSVFFIPFLPGLELNKNHYTVFGRVLSGMTAFTNLNRVKPARKDESEEESKKKPKLDPDEIISVEVIRKRDHVYEPKKLPLR